MTNDDLLKAHHVLDTQDKVDAETERQAKISGEVTPQVFKITAGGSLLCCCLF